MLIFVTTFNTMDYSLSVYLSSPLPPNPTPVRELFSPGPCPVCIHCLPYCCITISHGYRTGFAPRTGGHRLTLPLAGFVIVDKCVNLLEPQFLCLQKKGVFFASEGSLSQVARKLCERMKGHVCSPVEQGIQWDLNLVLS